VSARSINHRVHGGARRNQGLNQNVLRNQATGELGNASVCRNLASAALTKRKRRNPVADEPVIKLLEEIRDSQKEHVTSYKEAIRNQQEAIALQKGAVRRQKIAILVIVVVVVAFVLFVVLASHH
jgi:hypothetical protein